MKKLRLLYVDFKLPFLLKDIDYPIGGAAVEWFTWINGFKKNGYDIGILTWKGARKYINKEIDFDIIESYELNKGIPKLRYFYYYLPSLFKAIRDYEPDFVIQECAGILTGVMAGISKLLRIPFVYRVASDMDVDDRIKIILPRKDAIVYTFGLRNSDYVCCQNNYQMEKLKEKYPRKEMFVLHNPFISNGSIKVLNVGQKSYIAWIGIFKYEKNMPALLKIVKELPDIQFKIAGSPANVIDESTIEAMEVLRRCKNVKFAGYLKRSEIPAFLGQAYALLNTSIFEGFSNTFLESWAAGIPVISTKNVNPDNLINKYKLGMVADSYSDIPNIIKNLINSLEYQNIAARCRNYVENNHNPELLAKKFIENIYSYKK